MRHLKSYNLFESYDFTHTKCVDDNGDLLTVYHGSDQKFEEFTFNVGYNSSMFHREPVERGSFFFAESKADAERYGKYVYSVNLDIRKLDNWRDAGAMDEKLAQTLLSKYFSRIPGGMGEYWQMIDDSEIRDEIKKLGIDGIQSFEFDEDSDDPVLTWVVFDPKQIKIISVEEI